jgi:hypothetical protein
MTMRNVGLYWFGNDLYDQDQLPFPLVKLSGNTIRKDGLLTSGKDVFKTYPWILSTPQIDLLLPGESIATVLETS